MKWSDKEGGENIYSYLYIFYEEKFLFREKIDLFDIHKDFIKKIDSKKFFPNPII